MKMVNMGFLHFLPLAPGKRGEMIPPIPFPPFPPFHLFLSNYTARKTHGGGTTIIKKKTFSHSQNEIGETSDRLLQSALFAETEIRPAC